MSFLEDAFLLGQKLRETKEYQELKRAEALMVTDQAAKKLYKAYQNLQNAYRRMHDLGEQVTQENKEKLMGLHHNMMKNQFIKSYFEKKDIFMQLLKEVDQKISEGLSGPRKEEGCHT